ncbi:hypothetical protein R6Q59_006203 [Mikania micrantha]|uniref:Uncharacterized protein n=1 Tax=Mikania micrantha TaxID=192012 RepID=A0A5N6PUK6_9ASTR|nr:hypothetical protein E3N88_04482 [Mikania micrantha]
MICENHSTDISSVVGVCASCIRERLFRLILAQEQATGDGSLEQYTNSVIWRSVSPIGRRKYVNLVNPVATVQRPYNKPRLNHSQSDKRFYNSPQIVINTGGCIGGSSSNRKPTLIRFPSISSLFQSTSRDGDADSNYSEPCGGNRKSSVMPSPSWLSNVFPGAGVRRKNKAFHAGVVRNQRCVRDRGMSPVRSSSDGDVSDETGSFQSTESCKQTPVKTPSHQAVRRGGRRKSITELILCPLVRSSPNRMLDVKGKPPVDGGFSGDIRAPVPAMPHLSYAKSFSANRSRKIADFGRSDPNR